MFIVNFGDTYQAYGWSKTFTNVSRTGLPGDAVKRSMTYFGEVDDFVADQPTVLTDDTYNKMLAVPPQLTELREEYPGPPHDLPRPSVQRGHGERGPARRGAGGAPRARGRHRRDHGRGCPPRPRTRWPRPGRRAGDPSPSIRPPSTTWGTRCGWCSPSACCWRCRGDRRPVVRARRRVAEGRARAGISITLVLLSGIVVVAVTRAPFDVAHGWASLGLATLAALGLRFGARQILRALNGFGRFFNGMFSVFSNADFAALIGVQFLAMAADGVIRGSIAKSIAFGGQEGFDVTTVPNADYLLKVVLALYIPYVHQPVHRRVHRPVRTAPRAVALEHRDRGDLLGDRGRDAAPARGRHVRGPDRDHGRADPRDARDAGLRPHRARGEVGGDARRALGPRPDAGERAHRPAARCSRCSARGWRSGSAPLPSWIVVIGGAVVLVAAATVSPHPADGDQTARDELRPGGQADPARRRGRDPRGALARRRARAGLVPDDPLPVLGVHAVHVRPLLEEPRGGREGDTMALALVGGLGSSAARSAWCSRSAGRTRCPRSACCSARWRCSARVGRVRVLGHARRVRRLLFSGFFAFFVAKISADTIMQQAMPDDFRGRAFALFDIAYNLGFIVPALILSFVWVENDPGQSERSSSCPAWCSWRSPGSSGGGRGRSGASSRRRTTSWRWS